MYTIVGMVALAFVAAGVAIGIFAFGGGGGGGDASKQFEEAGGTLKTYPIKYPGNNPSNRHYEQIPKDFKYPSFPPTGGPHNPTPALFDVYDDPVQQSRLVHDLEHGGVVIQYGKDVPRSDVDEIVDWYRNDPNGIIIAPLPALGKKIALAAWNADLSGGGDVKSEEGVLGELPKFDENAFDAFMDAYAFKGPERFPKDDLAPGN
jgi:hypothetical protein